MLPAGNTPRLNQNHLLAFGLLLLATGVATGALSQASSFGVAFGGTGYDVSHWGEITPGGNYIMTGETYSFGAGSDDIYVVETDQNTAGIVWSRAYGTSASERSNCIQSTSDGGFVICGYTQTNGPKDILLLKTDATGNLQWAKSYGGASGEDANTVRETSDGGFIIVGETSNYSATLNSEMYVIKTDSSGAMQWNHTYGVSGFLGDRAMDVIEVPGPNYVIMGQTSTPGLTDVALLKIDSSGGTVLWSYRYNFVNYDVPNYFIQTSDSGFLITGYANTGAQTDIFLLKTNANGIVQWAKTYGDVYENRGWEVIQTADGGYALTGTWRAAFLTGNDFFILKTDASGNSQWLNIMGTSEDEIAEAGIRQTGDGGYVVQGFTCCGNVGPGDRDYLVYKTDDQGDIFGTCNVTVPTFTTSTPSISAIAITLQSQSFGSAGNPSITVTSVATQDVVLCSPPLLPVEWLSFTGHETDGQVVLQWSTASETGDAQFTVERSSDGSLFEGITTIPGASSSVRREPHDYDFTDDSPLFGINYYRLKVIETSGDYTYSSIARVNVTQAVKLNITPNPFSDELLIELPEGSQMLEVLTPSGAPICVYQLRPDDKGSAHVAINSTTWPAGIYSVRLVSSNGSVSSRMVVKAGD